MNRVIKSAMALIALVLWLATNGLSPLVELHVAVEHHHEDSHHYEAAHTDAEPEDHHESDHEHPVCTLDSTPVTPRADAGDLATLVSSTLAIESEPVVVSGFEPRAPSRDPDRFRARSCVLRI